VILYRFRVEFQLPANRYEKLISPNAVVPAQRETPVSRQSNSLPTRHHTRAESQPWRKG
jgi:hypothetical protein